MSGFDNELTGILGRNDRKEKDTHADFKGNATIGGVDYWVDAWVQERKDGSGRKFFKLKFRAKDEQQAGAAKGAGASGIRSSNTGRSAPADLNDAIPFAASVL